MKLVKITEKNAEKIMKAFVEAQGRATARTVDSFKDLERIIETVNDAVELEKVRYDGALRKHIDKGFMSKSALEGTVINYDGAEKFPNAYRYRPESTHFTMIFKNGGWQINIESIKRATCPNKNGRQFRIEMSDTAKAKVLEQYM